MSRLFGSLPWWSEPPTLGSVKQSEGANDAMPLLSSHVNVCGDRGEHHVADGNHGMDAWMVGRARGRCLPGYNLGPTQFCISCRMRSLSATGFVEG